MTNRDAMEHAMSVIEQQGRVRINRAKATAAPPSEPTEQEQADAAKDAEAWNMLRHLSRIL